MRPGRLRLAAGAAALVALAFVLARLMPAYLRDLEFQRALEEVVQRARESGQSDDVLRAQALDRAARLGLRVTPAQVRVKRAERRIQIEVLYEVRVTLPLYSVDLHFRPRAGG